jgi:hypothetical protein
MYNTETVESIEEYKEIDTYDLHTPIYHNFFLDNGILTHNSGKSLFTIICLILFGRPATLTDNIAYIPKGNEIMDKFDKLWFNMFIVDEAAAEMRSVNWQSKPQQKVNTMAMTDRFKNNAVFLIMPNFDEFTKSMRRGSLMFRAIVIYRTDTHARIIIQRKSRNWRSEDPWGDKLANKRYETLEFSKRKEITNESMLEIERSIPNTIMDFIIPNLEKILPEITNEYERLKAESRVIKNKDETKTGSSYYKNKYTELMTKVSKLLFFNELEIGKRRITKVEMAASLGVTVETLNRYIAIKENKNKNFRKK